VFVPHSGFIGELGEMDYKGKKVSVKLRQSDRNGAVLLMNELKEKILKGTFPLALPTGKPKIYVEKVEEKREREKNSNIIKIIQIIFHKDFMFLNIK
jgi:hypothetical protein